MIATLVALALIFTQLSLLAFGGGNTILPEMHRQVVQVHGWMSDAEFTSLFALAQAAPGPNMMIVTLVGWQVAGWQGMLVTTLAKFLPSSSITVCTVHVWTRNKDRPWRRIVQQGLLPVTAGLITSSAVLIAQASSHSAALWGITLGCAVLAHQWKWHPLLILLCGALAGTLFSV